MTETQQRFLRAIAERVPKEQVVELHLFPPIRQGGVETGVAVVAEGPKPTTLDVESIVEAVASGEEAEPSPYADEPGDPLSEVEAEVALDAGADDADAVGARSAADDRDGAVVRGNGHTPAVAFERLTIHTARYRLTLKGVDRGKWEVDVVAEADAPLEAIDAVIRGVQRRAGEGAEPDRLNGEAFRDALEAPLATLER